MTAHRLLQAVKDASKRAFPDVYARYLRWQFDRISLSARIAPILASPIQPICCDDRFEALQSTCTKWWPEYAYDNYSTWARGCERAVKLMGIPELRAPGLRMLEVGCGDGMTGLAVAGFGTAHVVLNDAQDWRDIRAQQLDFVDGDMCGRLPLESASFDFLYTYNTFEHVQDPKAALDELVRLCKTGGYIYIEFNPLYCSPLGLHAFSFLMPYPQFLFSPEFIERQVKELGVNDLGRETEKLQPTNKWRVGQFREIWRTSGCDIIRLAEASDERHLWIVAQFPAAFRGRGLTLEDLTIPSVAVLLRKR